MAYGGTLFVDAVLSTLARHYMPDPRVYVGRRLAPILGVPLRQAKYPVYSRDAFEEAEASQIDRAGEAPLITAELSTDVYRCRGHGLADVLTTIQQAEFQWQTPSEQKAESVLSIQSKLTIEHEKAVAAIVTNTALYTTAHVLDVNTASTAWNAAGGDPIADLTTMAFEIVKQTGRFPNVLWFDPNAWLALIKNAIFRTQYLPTYNGPITPKLFASLLSFPVEIVVAAAPERTSEPGAAEVMSFIWASSSTERCGLFYVTPGASRTAPSAMYTFGWQLPGSFDGFISGSWFQPGVGGVLGAEKIESDWFYDVRATGVYAAKFIAGAILYDLLT